jgi:hypothetical protein
VDADADAGALFSPVRRRVQRRVDRRFNRARYDADQTVAAFAAHLKDAVDLDSACEDLARVVQTALEPAHVSVWTSPQHAPRALVRRFAIVPVMTRSDISRPGFPRALTTRASRSPRTQCRSSGCRH